MSTQRVPHLTGQLLLDYWLRPRGEEHRFEMCFGCGKKVTQIAAVDVLYTVEVCACPAADYQHLINCIWHRECFLRVAGKRPEIRIGGPLQPVKSDKAR